MKLSKSVWQTYKEVPAEAEIPSHQLMIRAGLIHKLGAGLYSYMPFALRVIKKIEAIIRDELDKIDSQEVLMTMVTPSELWKESGRWEKMGDEMLRCKDKGERELCLSPTNEEAITDIFRKSVKSYKSLPTSLYQINTKFRDELRPRFGLMRAREFTMKDAYSFDMDKEGMDKSYAEFKQAYEAIFTRIGLQFSCVEADAGNMGSGDSQTHEFQVIAESGEDTIIYSEEGSYAANREKAKTVREELIFDKSGGELKEVSTPGMATIKDVCKFLKKPEYNAIKSLVYTVTKDGETEIVILQLLGDDELNPLKLKNGLEVDEVVPTPEHELKELGLPRGFIGAVNLPSQFKVIFDSSVDLEAFYVTGALKRDFHFENFNPKRDVPQFEVIDMRMAKKGDFTEDRKYKVDEKRGIEVAHIFQLGDKYTKSMNVNILDQNGKAKHPLMGCYGIGVTRVMAAAIEQNHDQNGIIWPKMIAPFDLYFAVIGKSEEIKETAEDVYESLKNAGFEVLFDDRKAGPGFKFKDSDLLGLPLRVVLGERDFNDKGTIEIVRRRTNEKIFVKKENLIGEVKRLLKEV